MGEVPATSNQHSLGQQTVVFEVSRMALSESIQTVPIFLINTYH